MMVNVRDLTGRGAAGADGVSGYNHLMQNWRCGGETWERSEDKKKDLEVHLYRAVN